LFEESPNDAELDEELDDETNLCWAIVQIIAKSSVEVSRDYRS
jgi:hypothetical protein